MPASAATTWSSAWTAQTEGYTQMGAEGANWVGEAPFSTRGHVFQNIGDGTYNHSGSLAIRAAAISGVNITYKIHFNDAVAMTGGQKVDGGLTVDQIARQVAAEGASASWSWPTSPSAIRRHATWPPGTKIHPPRRARRGPEGAGARSAACRC